MEPTIKQIKAICINSDGNITLKNILLSNNNHNTNDYDIFDYEFKCDFCDTPTNIHINYTKGSTNGPMFNRQKVSNSSNISEQYYNYVIFFYDSHNKSRYSKCPMNPFRYKCLCTFF